MHTVSDSSSLLCVRVVVEGVWWKKMVGGGGWGGGEVKKSGGEGGRLGVAVALFIVAQVHIHFPIYSCFSSE